MSAGGKYSLTAVLVIWTPSAPGASAWALVAVVSFLILPWGPRTALAASVVAAAVWEVLIPRGKPLLMGMPYEIDRGPGALPARVGAPKVLGLVALAVAKPAACGSPLGAWLPRGGDRPVGGGRVEEKVSWELTGLRELTALKVVQVWSSCSIMPLMWLRSLLCCWRWRGASQGGVCLSLLP